jgi:voltage-gated potassium channel
VSDRRARRAALGVGLLSAGRILVTVVVVLGVYFTAPVGRETRASGWAALFLGLLVIAALVAFQVRRILRSRRPVVQAAEALTLSALLFLSLFAGLYFTMQDNQPGSFSTPLTKMDALYFTVTVFATVGFGDITASSETARAVVTVQMVVDLIFIGVAIRVLLAVTKEALTRKVQGGERTRPD